MVEINAKLKAKAEEYMEVNSISKAALSATIGVHRTSVSQYFTGNEEALTQGTVDNIEEGLALILGGTDAKSVPQDGKTYRTGSIHQTDDTVGIIAVCQSCQDDMGFGIVVGKSGFGKTYTLKYYSRSPRVAYIECNEAMNARDLVKAIEKQIGLPHIMGTINDRLDSIKAFFNANTGYLLIIDEADKLITRYAQKKAEILRTIFDDSDVGMVLSGEPALENMIKQYIPRMANRIDLYWKLKGLKKNDVISYIDGCGFDDAASEEMVKRATNDKNGCFRLLDRTFRNVMRLAKENITLDTVREASSMMLL